MKKESGELRESPAVPVLEMDMREVRMLPGAARVAAQLVDGIVEQCVWGRADVSVIHRLDPGIAPELTDMGIQTVQFQSRLSVAEDFPAYRKQIQYGMQAAFSLLQYPEQLEAVLDQREALIFHFSGHTWLGSHYLVVEFVPESHFLRMTMECENTRCLDLTQIPHRKVDAGENFLFLPDRERVVLELFQSIHGESYNQQTEYDEIPQRQKALFRNLQDGGMTDLVKIKFHWSNTDIPMILDNSDRTTRWFLDKMLFLLEHQNVLRDLAAGQLLHVQDRRYSAYLDLSQGGKVLNISFNRPRKIREMDEYVDKMPRVRDWVAGSGEEMAGVRVFLIHHMTAEILGMIHGMDRLATPFLHVLFVKYQGLVPDSFLESIGSLPADRFQFHALRHIRSESSIEGSYLLSDQYSPVARLSELKTALGTGEKDFFTAMRLTAGHLFFRDAVQARKKGESILLVEDGGYLAPEINRLSLEGRTLGEALSHFDLNALAAELPVTEKEMKLKGWLASFFAGSVEHTRNGYDYLQDVEKRFHTLAFPAATIAVSRLKRGEEAMGTSTSIVHAVESILHGQGKMLCYRNVVVLGSRGAIGSNLMRELSNRLSGGRVAGVDLVCDELPGKGEIPEARTIEELGEERLRDKDLFVGVTGKSVLSREFLNWLLLNGEKPDLYFASGSTKTVEFASLIQLLQDIRSGAISSIDGVEVGLETVDIRDPQTGVIQGSQYRLSMEPENGKGKRVRNIYLLAGGMPVNFLYYGVPSEMFDRVLKQLMQLSCWLVEQHKTGRAIPPKLLAVDKEISLEELGDES
jgi:hypothetical protein